MLSDLVRSGVARPLVDEALWARLAPLIPAPRKKRGHRHGRGRIPDRAVLTGILPQGTAESVLNVL